MQLAILRQLQRNFKQTRDKLEQRRDSVLRSLNSVLAEQSSVRFPLDIMPHLWHVYSTFALNSTHKGTLNRAAEHRGSPTRRILGDGTHGDLPISIRIPWRGGLSLEDGLKKLQCQPHTKLHINTLFMGRPGTPIAAAYDRLLDEALAFRSQWSHLRIAGIKNTADLPRFLQRIDGAIPYIRHLTITECRPSERQIAIQADTYSNPKELQTASFSDSLLYELQHFISNITVLRLRVGYFTTSDQMKDHILPYLPGSLQRLLIYTDEYSSPWTKDYTNSAHQNAGAVSRFPEIKLPHLRVLGLENVQQAVVLGVILPVFFGAKIHTLVVSASFPCQQEEVYCWSTLR